MQLGSVVVKILLGVGSIRILEHVHEAGDGFVAIPVALEFAPKLGLDAIDFSKPAAVEVRECLTDLSLRVHDERAMTDNRLVDRLAA